MGIRVATAALALVMLSAACASDGEDSSPEPAAGAPEVTESAAPEEPVVTEEPEDGTEADATAGAPEATEDESIEPAVVDAPDGWPLPNLDHAATRSVFGSAIDSTTVDDLELSWTYPFGVGTRATSTPIIIEGVVYIGDLNTNVHAIDLESGEGIWKADGGGPTFGPGGVVVEGGLAFANHLGSGISAFDAATGEQIWFTNLVDEAGGGFVLIQPTVADGKVLASTTSLQMAGARGTLFGLDQRTGGIEWSFDTIESPDLWGDAELNSGGGAWFPPAVDVASGIAYWGTANPNPFPGSEGFPNGSSRPGDNRWTDSVLAVDVTTGGLLWGDQAIEHDIFDRDSVITAIAELPSGDRIVIHTGKLGIVRGLTQVGEVLWETPIGMHLNDDLDSISGPTEVLPGGVGGVTAPVATADGVVYTSVLNAPALYGGPDQRETGFNSRFGEFDSEFYAIDAATGEVIWQVDLPGDSTGGATVVNDLVFTSVIEPGQLLALDRATGAPVWAFDVPGQVDGWPAIVDDMVVVPTGGYNEGGLIALRLAD